MISVGEFCATFSAAMSHMLVGVNIAWPSAGLRQLMVNGTEIPIDDHIGSWIVCVMSLGGASGAILSPSFVDKLGRKLCLLSTIVFFETGLLLITFVRNKYVLIFSRIILGLGNGVTLSVCPMYIAEVSSPQNKGVLGGLMHFNLCIGILYCYILGSVLKYTQLGVGCIIISALFFLWFLWMPETPVWLLTRRRHTEALIVLGWLRGETPGENLQREIRKMSMNVRKQTEHKASMKSLFTRRGNRKGLRAILSIVFTQQLSGMSAILCYASWIFESSGIKVNRKVAPIILGSVLVVSSLMSLFFIVKTDRKNMLIISCVGCSISLLLQTIYFQVMRVSKSIVSNIEWLTAVFLASYLFMFNLGLGPISTLIIGEMFPINIKAVAGSVAAMVAALCCFVIYTLFPYVSIKFGCEYSFGFFSVCSLLGILFISSWVPETKDKTLAEVIEQLFKGPSLVKRILDMEKFVKGHGYFILSMVRKKIDTPDSSYYLNSIEEVDETQEKEGTHKQKFDEELRTEEDTYKASPKNILNESRKSEDRKTPGPRKSKESEAIKPEIPKEINNPTPGMSKESEFPKQEKSKTKETPKSGKSVERNPFKAAKIRETEDPKQERNTRYDPSPGTSKEVKHSKPTTGIGRTYKDKAASKPGAPKKKGPPKQNTNRF